MGGGGHQPTMGGGVISQLWVGGSLTNYGGRGGNHHAAIGRGGG